MRRSLLTVIMVLLLPATCFALAFSVIGNEPQAAENYVTWPGLVDVVNDVSRASLVWVNGDERLRYRGEISDLNRVLKEFGEVEADERHLILLPGPGPGVSVDVNMENSAVPADWELHVLGGITRGVAQEFQIESVLEIHPTLRVYISDRIPLDKLEVREEE